MIGISLLISIKLEQIYLAIILKGTLNMLTPNVNYEVPVCCSENYLMSVTQLYVGRLVEEGYSQEHGIQFEIYAW